MRGGVFPRAPSEPPVHSAAWRRPACASRLADTARLACALDGRRERAHHLGQQRHPALEQQVERPRERRLPARRRPARAVHRVASARFGQYLRRRARLCERPRQHRGAHVGARPHDTVKAAIVLEQLRRGRRAGVGEGGREQRVGPAGRAGLGSPRVASRTSSSSAPRV
eukprot:1518110-Prymnesium_polylepis.1